MQILFLSAWFPYPYDNGIKLRTYHLLRGLAHSHEVDLLCFSEHLPPNESLSHLQTFLHRVEVVNETAFAGRSGGQLVGLLSPKPRSLVANHSAQMEARVRQETAQQQYDLIIAEDIHMIPYALAVGNVPIIFEGLEVLRIYEQYQQASDFRSRVRNGLTWLKTRNYILSVFPRLAGVTFASDMEQALFHMPSNLVVGIVPNGVDLAGLHGDFGTPEADTLIYAGSISYDANFDAVSYYLSDIHPHIHRHRPQAHLRVTGKADPTRIAALPHTEGIEFTGFLSDIRPAVARAWAEVVPLRNGSGTRLKVLEALALGTPIISTTKGVEGLDLHAGRDILVADTPQGFAAHVIHLLESSELRQSLAEHGRRAVESYDWRHSVRRLEHVIEEATRRATHTNH